MMMKSAYAANIAAARHFLFVPGNRPERFDKAAASGADVVVIDLEDAVPAPAKAQARDDVRRWLEAGGSAMVRINAIDAPWFAEDLALAHIATLQGLMVPKAEAGDAIIDVARLSPVVALVETARGVTGIDALAAVPGIVRLAFGTIDFTLDCDLTASDRQLDPVRLAMTIASTAAGIAAPIDGVTVRFDDPLPVEMAARAARSMGFRAKLCIHPAQLSPVAAAMTASEEELERASRIVAADRAASGSAVSLDGEMIDRPIVARAYRLLAEGADGRP
ncbi:HpcH/HpaI aldolase/citrate lyase family protein [Sphingopyxis sp. MC1]|uniref:HpcH/HpaI aldolase/citrate lyase family protein n=1 Tax=Sphingopyxis sp. MC1 TaxID=1174684 RepID=UPI00058E81EA|nr:CoA ester lyase [Sphingopyxis sp. MC1]